MPSHDHLCLDNKAISLANSNTRNLRPCIHRKALLVIAVMILKPASLVIIWQLHPPRHLHRPKRLPANIFIKELPTVRDHVTSQLIPEGDEYIPREYDQEGEKKVTASGHLLGGCGYKCETFLVPNRGDKLFMLGTQCARVLGYRDTYLMFNRNRPLYKIIATQAEKEYLIRQNVIPFPHRSRQD